MDSTFFNSYDVKVDDIKKQYIEKEQSLIVHGMVGSGKTSLIMARIAYLMKVKNISNRRIMVLAYDRNSAKDIKDKFARLYPDLDSIQVFDIYHFALKILMASNRQRELPTKKTYRDLNVFITRIVKELYKCDIRRYESLELLRLINEVRNETFDERIRVKVLSKIEHRFDLVKIYQQFEKIKHKKEIIDFEDLIQQVYLILDKNPNFKQQLLTLYDYIFIDDASETSYISYQLISLLWQDKTVMICGNPMIQIDKERCIKNNILEIMRQDLKCDVVSLDCNYRNNRSIHQVSSMFINRGKLVGEVDRKDEGEIKFKRFSDLARLYEYSFKKIVDDDMPTAFIYRNLAMAIPLIDMLRRANIAYDHSGKIKEYFNEPFVKSMRTLIKLVCNPYDVRSFIEVYPILGLEIPRRVLLEIDRLMRDNEQLDVYHALLESSYKQSSKPAVITIGNGMLEAASLNTLDMVLYLLEKMQIQEYWQGKGVYAQDAIVLTFEVLAQFYPKPQDFLYEMSQLKQEEARGSDRVFIDSILRVYGKEFNRVCILDCMKGLIPFDENDPVERMMFYYAMSRSKGEMELFTAKKIANRKLEVSSYLYELNNYLNKKKASEEGKESVKKLRPSLLKRGVAIHHQQFGDGKIVSVDQDLMKVVFNDGIKVVNIKLCIKNKLISIIDK